MVLYCIDYVMIHVIIFAIKAHMLLMDRTFQGSNGSVATDPVHLLPPTVNAGSVF